MIVMILELAAKMIQNIKFENTTSTYSLTGKLEYDYKNHDEKTMLYKMFVAYNCNGCSTAPLTGFSQSEYCYVFLNKGYIMTYKNYNISKEDEFQICKSKVSIKKIY